MSELKLTGKIHAIFETQTIGESFQKREFVVETDEKYPQLVKLEFVQDAVTKLDGLSKGQAVKVAFNIRGREWTSPKNEVKYFVTLQAWRISTLQQSENPAPMAATTEVPPADNFADELPF